MTSEQTYLGNRTKEVWDTNNHIDAKISESHVETDDPTDFVHRPASEDGHALEEFIEAHPRSTAASSEALNHNLPFPVVIPQRRPGNKSRGFVEAYAPALGQFGIQQDEFIGFIRAVNRAVRASKWLGAIQLAAAGTSFVPNSIALGASVAVQLVAGIIAKAETRWKTNSLLDRVNEDYFRPRGLYCLLMAYKPITFGEIASFDVVEAVAQDQSSSSTALSDSNQKFPALAKKNLRDPVSGTVQGEENLPPNVAPLVYPDTSVVTHESRTLAKGQSTMARVTNYFDERAQARNRYLDPNHPATNGGLLGLISGGHLSPNPEKVNQRMQGSLDAQAETIQEQKKTMMDALGKQLTTMHLPPEQEKAYIKQYEDVFHLQEQQLRQQTELLDTGTGRVRTLWNVSYLMIVELPSDEQIATAHRNLESSDGRQFGPDMAISTVEI